MHTTGQRRISGNPLVFPSAGGQPISAMRLPKLLQNHKIATVPLGFRSSFRDWAAEETNHSREVVEAALAHVSANVAMQVVYIET